VRGGESMTHASVALGGRFDVQSGGQGLELIGVECLLVT